MGTTPVTLANATDTWVYEVRPTKAHGTSDTKLYVGGQAGNQSQSFLYFGLPFPRGVTVISAKLRLVQDSAWTGTKNLSVGRIATAWSSTKMTWNNRPGTSGPLVQVSKTSPGDLTTWEWDVTSLMQYVSGGGVWYGFRLSADSATAAMRFHSPQAARTAYRPVLEISWKDNPVKPSVLHPADGRSVSLAKPILSCDFTDLSGDTSMAAMQVRIFSSEANAAANTSPEFDSGEVATDVPQLDLATTAYAGLADGATRWWRVMVKDGAGLWSAWSDYEQFTRNSKGTLTLNNPAAAPNNFVSEATPPMDWSFTGRTQKAYQIAITDSTSTNKWLWTSGKITSTATVATIPTGVLKDSSKTYNVLVRVWDTIDRENTAGDPPYVEVSRSFTYQYDGTVAPATGLVGTAGTKYPTMGLTWSRTTQPDEWNIYRDNVLVWAGPASNLFTSGTSYAYTDRLATPRKASVWKVVAVVNGKGSSGSPTVTATVVPQTLVLSDTNGSNPVLIFNYDAPATLSEVSQVFQPAGAGAPVVLTQSEHGYQGHVSGVLIQNPVDYSLTSQQWRDRFNQLKRLNGDTLLLTLIDDAFECFIQNANIRPMMDGEGVKYQVDFDFFQTDWVEP